MILKVVQLPNPLLKKPSAVVHPKDPGLQTLIDHMLETMDHHPRCVGLAAPQIGHSVQVIVMHAARAEKPGSDHGRLALLNPRLLHQDKPKLFREGCLSIPDYTGNILRATEVEVSAWDRHGRAVLFKATGFEAIVFQHEIDHIQGRLFLDRVASLETDVFRRKSYG